MEGSPDPLAVILGTVAFAVVTIGGIFSATLLWARYLQRRMPAAVEMLAELRERQEAYAASLKWGTPFGLVALALTLAGLVLASSGRPTLFGVVLVLLLPAGLIVGGLSMVKTQFAIVRRPLRWSDRILTGQDAVRRGRVLIAIGLGLLVACLALTLLTYAGSWVGRGVPIP